MEIKILQVFYGKDGLPYKDKDRQVHFPIIGAAIQGASNTTKIRFYFDELVSEDDETTTWVVVSKLPNGKIGSEIVETELDSELNEHYALFSLKNFYTQAKGDLFLSLQGYQGGVQVETDPNTGISQIIGTPTIAATGSIKLAINYATQLVGSGETANINFQKILACLGTKLGIRAFTEKVDELPTTGQTNVFYAIYDDPTEPNKLNIYVWNGITQSYVWVGDNSIYLGDYYTKENGEKLEQEIEDTNSRIDELGGMYNFKGSKTVAQINALTGMTAGDAYNVTDSGTITTGSVSVSAGDNVAWTGTAWDKLSNSIVLSGFATKEYVTQAFEDYDEDINRKITAISSYIGDDLTYVVEAGIGLTSAVSIYPSTNGMKYYVPDATNYQTFTTNNSSKYLIILKDEWTCTSRYGGIWKNFTTVGNGRISIENTPFPDSNLYYGLLTNAENTTTGVPIFQWGGISGDAQINDTCGGVVVDVTSLLENNPFLVGNSDRQTAYNIINFFGVDKINALIDEGKNPRVVGDVQNTIKDVYIDDAYTLYDMFDSAKCVKTIKSVLGPKNQHSFSGETNLNLWNGSGSGFAASYQNLPTERFGGKVYIALSYDNIVCSTRYIGLWDVNGVVGGTNRETLSAISGHTGWYGAIIVPSKYKSDAVFVAQYLSITSASGNVLPAVIDITEVYENYVGANRQATVKNFLDELGEDAVLSIINTGELKQEFPMKLDVSILSENGKSFGDQVGKQWNGKKWIAFGTSITDTSFLDNNTGAYTGKYIPYLMGKANFQLNMQGIAGGTIATGGIYSAGGNILTRILSTDVSDADIVTIEGFVNDYACGVPLGDESSSTKYSLFGALRLAIDYIQQNSNAVIVLLTENTGKEVSGGGGNYYYYTKHQAYKSEDDTTIVYIYQNDYNEVIRKVAKFAGCYCIDAGAKSQINVNHPSYLIDHIHQSELGAYQYAEAIWEELKFIPLNKKSS